MACPIDKKVFFFTILAIITNIAWAQTAVQMKLPAQSSRALNVVPLFETPLPSGASVALSSLNFDISGGYPPYTLAWFKDNQAISNWNVAIIQTGTNTSYLLKVTDQNKCTVSTEINLRTSKPVLKVETEADILPTMVSDYIKVVYPAAIPSANVTIVNIQGTIIKNIVVSPNSIIPVNFPCGMYIVMLKGMDFSVTKKIIVSK